MTFENPIAGEVRVADFTWSTGGAATCIRSTRPARTGRLLLTSFVWPFDVHRHQRLAAALRLAAEHPVAVDRAAARSGWPSARAVRSDGVLPVVWHSITQLYWPAAEVDGGRRRS